VVEKQEQSKIYSPGTTYLHPEYLIFHHSDSLSQLIIKINTDELLFNQANPENALQAKVKIRYQLIDITDNPTSTIIADSATIEKKIEKTPGKNYLVQTYVIKTQYGKTYSLKISFSDVLRGVNQSNYVFVNKTNRYSGQNFKTISRTNDMPMFKNYIFPGEKFRIINNMSGLKKLYIKYRKDDTPLPPPPFSVQTELAYNFTPDSLWAFPYVPQQSYLFEHKGNYLITTDSLQNEGLFLINAGRSFPKVVEPDMMIPPLEYLTTTEEFNALKKEENSKLAVDNFWQKMAGNNLDMAREIIRIYYNRMFYANLFFTSYKQGWRTDRGMIYIIFGPPSAITKNATSETWEYYVRQDASNLTITFNKVASKYTENHYVMIRNDSYSRFWRMAVDSWRKGKAFSLEE
jgi:GWxTD domain-containing protein